MPVVKFHSEETKRKMSLAKKGKMPKNLAWLHKHIVGKKRPDLVGENNSNWTGDKVTYRKLHDWVQYHLGKANHCENDLAHIATRYHWSNISGEYKRDLLDWKQLCPKCNKNDGIKTHPRYVKGGDLYSSL